MAWLDGMPHQPLPYTGVWLDPVACVMHRTIGKYGGDKAVLSRGRVPSVHFLVGQRLDEWVQFYDTNSNQPHAAGANSWAVGIEFSGQNSDVEELTDWQIECGRHIVTELARIHQIPRVFLEAGPRVSGFRGFLNHANIDTTPQYTHYDFITKHAWDRMVDGTPAPALPSSLGDDMILCQNADKKDEFVIVTGGGVIPCPPGEAVKLRTQGKIADADKVGEWVLDNWVSVLGGKLR